MVPHKDINRIRREAIGESMKMKFKPGDLVIERTHRYPPSIRTAPRKGMIYRIIMRPGDTKWYEIHFFGSSTTIEWAKT